MPKEAKILLSIGLLVIIGAIALIVTKPATTVSEQPIDTSIIIRENSHTVGSADAKVKVVEFGDYQCPACAYAHPIVLQLMKDYANNPNVSFTFRNFPLPGHKNAIVSSQAAEAASAQGKFWEMHDMLYEKQDEWSELTNPKDVFSGYATALGLDVAKFNEDVSKNAYAAIISADKKDGEDLNLAGTPSFFISGEKFGVGSVPTYEEFKAKIEEKLK
ncbi:MAG: DsbA family protein [Candidatus Pacebacteria bacterium]|nr:DsbA family protein [Candidatus Paceibacterota bacterium]MBP9852300.1 DsbA family protein [Candidatus Paceibacterota bacterium]